MNGCWNTYTRTRKKRETNVENGKKIVRMETKKLINTILRKKYKGQIVNQDSLVIFVNHFAFFFL